MRGSQVMTPPTGTAPKGALLHSVLSYRTLDEYVAGVVPFLRSGLEVDEPALVMVPQSNGERLGEDLNGSSDGVTFLDAGELTRNPARAIPTARNFAEEHAGRRIRVVGELAWPGRSAPEIREAIRHEACVNALFADVAATVLCPYDTTGLDADVLADAYRTHPYLYEAGEHRQSVHYVEALDVLSSSAPWSPAPDGAVTKVFHHGDLPKLRRLAHDFARGERMSGDRLEDLLIALNEVMTNTLLHTRMQGTVRLWREADLLVCEVSDRGHITDPFVGRRQPPPDSEGGRGLWMVNQLSDLLEMRTSEAGTDIRIYFGVT